MTTITTQTHNTLGCSTFMGLTTHTTKLGRGNLALDYYPSSFLVTWPRTFDLFSCSSCVAISLTFVANMGSDLRVDGVYARRVEKKKERDKEELREPDEWYKEEEEEETNYMCSTFFPSLDDDLCFLFFSFSIPYVAMLPTHTHIPAQPTRSLCSLTPIRNLIPSILTSIPYCCCCCCYCYWYCSAVFTMMAAFALWSLASLFLWLQSWDQIGENREEI